MPPQAPPIHSLYAILAGSFVWPREAPLFKLMPPSLKFGQLQAESLGNG
jgi:hypothetical protein